MGEAETREGRRIIGEVMRFYGVEGIEEKVEILGRYLGLLGEKRTWAGLVSKGGANAPEDLVVDSLGVLSIVPPLEDRRIVDIGAGGGVLGVVLAVACPGWGVSMVESSARKCAFLAETAGALGIENAEVIHERAERLAGPEGYEVAVSRAAGRLTQVASLAMSLLKPGGIYVALKGRNVSREIEEFEKKCAPGTVEISKPSHQAALCIPDRTTLVVLAKM